MPPVSKPGHDEYDFIVVGGGSGGIGAAVCIFVQESVVGLLMKERWRCSDEQEATERRLR